MQGAVEIPDPPKTLTSLLHYTYRDLYPSCQYRFRIRCRSASGWSEFNSWIFGKTLAHRAEAPLPLEVRKISVNGMVFTWFPPKRDNGFPIDFYQLELADHHAISGTGDSRNTPFIVLKNDEDEEEEEEQQQPEQPVDEEDSRFSSSNSISSPMKKPGVGGLLKSKQEPQEKIVGIPSSGSIASSSSSSLIPKTKSKSITIRRKRESQSAGQGGVSKYYRLMKHKQLDLLMKYITGLEGHRLYQARVRAHNELGFSPWSQWCFPVAPKVGVWLKSFHAQELSMLITWFAPILNPHREVDAYELQICNIQGPMVVNHPAPSKELIHISMTKLKDHSKPNQDINEFITLSNEIRENEYTVKHLKAGRKYQFRVRAILKDETEWPDWENASVMSDIIQMSPTIPDPPVNLRPYIYDPSSAQTTENNNKNHTNQTEWEVNPVNIFYDRVVEDEKKYIAYFHEMEAPSAAAANNNNESENNQITADPSSMLQYTPRSLEYSQGGDSSAQQLMYNPTNRWGNVSDVSVANSQTSEFKLPQTKIDLEDGLDIAHNYITITFVNGDSNGELIEAQEIQLSKIRNYHIQDIICAKEAFLGVHEEDDDEEDENDSHNDTNNTNNKRRKSYEQRMNENMKPFLLSEPDKEKNSYPFTGGKPSMEGLVWETVYNNDNKDNECPSKYSVELLAKQVYRIKNLYPGSIYIFRIRSKNKLGWSPFSHSSPLIGTYPSIPPEKPLLLVNQQTFAIFMWKEMEKVSSASSAINMTNSSVDEEASSSLTTLEYQIQIRQIAVSRRVDHLTAVDYDNDSLSYMTTGSNPRPDRMLIEFISNWKSIAAEVLTFDQLKKVKTVKGLSLESTINASDLSTMKYVILSGLVEFSWYLVRIRIRTVIGWSPWSSPSDPFRMAK
jgi:hypothetical protein